MPLNNSIDISNINWLPIFIYAKFSYIWLSTQITNSETMTNIMRLIKTLLMRYGFTLYYMDKILHTSSILSRKIGKYISLLDQFFFPYSTFLFNLYTHFCVFLLVSRFNRNDTRLFMPRVRFYYFIYSFLLVTWCDV